jgi:hypothetical protein
MAKGYDWPRGFDRTPTNLRKPYPHGFQVSVTEAFENIVTQLERLGADKYTIESAADHQTKNPNFPYADANPDDPSVVVRYRMEGDTYAIPCDRWDNLRDNAQAVAKYVDAKRALDRYGIETKTTEWETQIISGDDDGGSSGGFSRSDGGAPGGATDSGSASGMTDISGGDTQVEDDVSTTDTEVFGETGAGSCPDCGSELPADYAANFCPDCGSEL